MAAVVSLAGNRMLVLVREEAPACPKCGTTLTDADACARCGLLASHMSAYRANLDTSVPTRVSAAWEQAVARWDDPAAHDHVVAMAVELESFAWIATRYREIAKTGDEVAKAQLARIARAAEISMTIGAVARRAEGAEKAPYRGLQILSAALILIVLGTWVYARFRQTSQEGPAPITSIPGR